MPLKLHNRQFKGKILPSFELLIAGTAAYVQEYAKTIGFGGRRVMVVRRGNRFEVYAKKNQKDKNCQK